MATETTIRRQNLINNNQRRAAEADNSTQLQDRSQIGLPGQSGTVRQNDGTSTASGTTSDGTLQGGTSASGSINSTGIGGSADVNGSVNGRLNRSPNAGTNGINQKTNTPGVRAMGVPGSVTTPSSLVAPPMTPGTATRALDSTLPSGTSSGSTITDPTTLPSKLPTTGTGSSATGGSVPLSRD